MKIDKEFVEVCEKLNKYGVKYVVCGGYAIKLHGVEDIAKQERKTMDYDFIVESSKENIARIKKALTKVAPKIKELKDKDLNKYSTVMIVNEGDKYLNTDLISSVWSVNYKRAHKDMEIKEVRGVKIPVVSIDILLEMKKDSSRARDITDTFYLKQIKEKGSEMK